jgi:pimeloyl-ACP methyl ester carboxylesterase
VVVGHSFGGGVSIRFAHAHRAEADQSRERSTEDAQRERQFLNLVGELGDIRRRKPWEIERVKGPLIAGYGSLSKPHLQDAAELLGRLPDCRVVKIEGAHHNAHSGSPDDFVNLLVQPLVERVVQGTWS